LEESHDRNASLRRVRRSAHCQPASEPTRRLAPGSARLAFGADYRLAPGSQDNGVFDGKQQVLNLVYSVYGIWYSDTLFKKNGWTYVLAQGLAFLAIQQGYQNDWSALFAGLTITTVPLLAVYVLFQGKLEKGLTAGALRG
jgi:hypothetical protein